MLSLINRIVLLATVAIIASTGLAQTNISGVLLNPPGAIWESWIRDPNYELELKDLAATGDGSSICVLIGYRAKGNMSGLQRLRLDSLNANGALDFSVELNGIFLNDDAGRGRSRIDAMAISKDRIVYLVSALNSGIIRLTGISLQARGVVLNRTISFGRTGVEIQGARSAENGGIYVFGTVDGRGFIAQFNEDKVVWKRSPEENSAVVRGGSG